nr:hypothetical protein [Tanacetum cinerariifolium]
MGCCKEIDEMLTIKLCVARTNEEIFTLEAWTRAFNIDEPIYSELCHEFYSTYEFDEVYDDDELRTKTIIKFRLCGRAFSWTLLEFSRRLELYHLEETNKEGFDVYLHGGLHINDHFDAREYWLSISREENLNLLRSHHLWIVSEDKWISKRKNLLTDGMLNSLSAPIYCRALDTTTLKELIDSMGRLIPEVLEPGALRVAIPRAPRASMHDLYERIGSMEIRHGAIERISYRQSYHWIGMLGYLSTWLGSTMFHCMELTTHLVMISSSSTSSIISNTHLSSCSNQMVMSSVEIT